MKRKLDVILSEEDVLEAFYNNANEKHLNTNEEIRNEYNKFVNILDLDTIPENPIFDESWLMPNEYFEINLKEYFNKLVETQEEKERIGLELELFKYSESENLLRYLIYLVDFMNEREIVWGVGRGSSVSVYCFYLIGLHKVNSIKYNLDCTEFFKIKE